MSREEGDKGYEGRSGGGGDGISRHNRIATRSPPNHTALEKRPISATATGRWRIIEG